MVITPVSRPENLDLLFESIYPNHRFDTKWMVVIDETAVPNPFPRVFTMLKHLPGVYTQAGVSFYTYPSKDNGLSGNPQRNFALGKLDSWLINQDFWVYFLDDDNVMHPDFFQEMSEEIQRAPSTLGFVVDQIWRDGRIRIPAHPNRMRPTFCDTAQFLLHCSAIGEDRWDPWDYCADGHFFSKIYRRHSDHFVFVEKRLAYYNALRSRL